MERAKVWIFLMVIAALAALYAGATLSAENDDDSSSDDDSVSGFGSGVSSFLAANISQLEVPLKLMNPTGVTQVSAVFVYERRKDENDAGSTMGVFLSCVVQEIPPHGATGFSTDLLGETRAYAEVITVPLDDDNGSNGLGVISDPTFGHSAFLLDPDLFALPSDEVVPGQRQDAIDCVCDELDLLGLPLDLFEDFGVDCTSTLALTESDPSRIERAFQEVRDALEEKKGPR